MTYEELRQRCLNHAGMHPSNPSSVTDIADVAKDSRLRDVARELAAYIDMRRAKHSK